MIKNFIERWRRSSIDRSGLDSLLGHAPQVDADLRERLIWFRKIVHWISGTGHVQVTRLRYIFQILEKNTELKKKIASLMRSIVSDTSALELFMNVGIPNEQGFIGEFLERLHWMLLPQAPRDEDLISVFTETFRFQSDPEWIKEIDPVLFRELVHLFSYDTKDARWNTLLSDVKDAVLLLSQSINSIGMSRLVRNRVKERNFRSLPVF